MYSRTYLTGNDEKISLPESYDGVAFGDLRDAARSADTQNTDSEEFAEASSDIAKNPWEQPKQTSKEEVKEVPAGLFSGLRKSTWFKSLFGGNSLFGIEGLKMPKIGTEELLIAATALFLLFSKDGDRECGIILLLLLFVN